jgi:hypothetical protein
MPVAADRVPSHARQAGGARCATRLFLFGAALLVVGGTSVAEVDPEYERHRRLWERSHFPPGEDSLDGRCLGCHADVLEQAPRRAMPAGALPEGLLPPYQRLATYDGGQASFHWRHRRSSYAQSVMRMRCQSCHRGRDPRLPEVHRHEREFPVALRKRVHPNLCVNCHGRFPDHRAAFDGDWPAVRQRFDGNCLVCHEGDSARRHHNPLLDREAVEAQARDSGDVCYGCHGGRAWYRVSASAIRGKPYDLRGEQMTVTGGGSLSGRSEPPAETPLIVR